MFPATYAIFLIITILYNKTASCFDSFYGVKTNIESAGRCLGTCGITINRTVMISHDETTKTCMCCSDITGSDIAGPNWKSFVPRTCKYLIVIPKKIETDLKLSVQKSRAKVNHLFTFCVQSIKIHLSYWSKNVNLIINPLQKIVTVSFQFRITTL